MGARTRAGRAGNRTLQLTVNVTGMGPNQPPRPTGASLQTEYRDLQREEEKERSEREVVHESVPTSGGLIYTSRPAV